MDLMYLRHPPVDELQGYTPPSVAQRAINGADTRIVDPVAWFIGRCAIAVG